MRDTHGRSDATLSSLAPWNGDSRAGTDLAPGTRIKQYELIREVGRGGMGVVYVARDLVLGRRVAIKFLRAVDREVLDRFLVEARATAQASHENIVIIYEADVYEAMPYMVLEYIEGKPLRDFMGPWGEGVALPASRVVELMLPVARALARAHELGIVHRDLKPENIMVTDAGQVKVLDFGIAKALGQQDMGSQSQIIDAARSLTLTREGHLVGTLPYMSPEQLGQDAVDHRSDLFSLGQIMFEMLAGRHAIEPLSSDMLVQNLIDTEPMRSLRTVVAETPAPLAEVVDACLLKQKAARMSSAAELADRLENLLPGRRGRALAEGESPFPGLTAFQEADANRFFGRSRDVARMVSRVRELPLTGVVGPSGVGKSSFIRAGVTPALKTSGESWEVITIRPGRYPLSTLAGLIERLARTLTQTPSSTSTAPDREHGQLIGQLRREPGLLGSRLRERAATSNTQLLLFVDQFEELYTLATDADERRAFTAALSAVADDPAAPLRVVVSMRSDFLDRASEDQRFLDGLSRGLVFLSPPDRDGLREALELPVEMVGYRFETSAMVGDMLDTLASTPGALPLLQFACAKLWDARDRQRRLLTASSYNAIGGISGALATHADEVVRNMSTAAQKLTQRIFRQLVTPERTRAIVDTADLYGLSPDREEIQRVLDQLVAARLLVVQTRTDTGGSVEIVHESLIDRWPTLRRWLDEDQESAAFLSQLAAAAKQWESRGRATGLLWRGEAHDEARRWYTTQPRQLGAREEAFLDEVLALGRRGARTRRIAVVGAFVVLAAIAAGASIGFLKVSAARDEARLATENAEQKEQEAKRERDDARAAMAAQKQAEASASEAKQNADLANAAKKVTAVQLDSAHDTIAAQMAELKKAAADAEAARAQAEAEKKKAMAAKAEADAQRDRAEKALADKVARDAERANTQKTISTHLKD